MCPETPIRTAAYVSVPHLFPMHIVRSCVLKMSDLSGANWWCVRNRSSTACGFVRGLQFCPGTARGDVYLGCLPLH